VAFARKFRVGGTGVSYRLPAELEERLVALESSNGLERDFDRVSWIWLVALGVVLPLLLLLVGWWL
jgi:hypothetical protein